MQVGMWVGSLISLGSNSKEMLPKQNLEEYLRFVLAEGGGIVLFSVRVVCCVCVCMCFLSKNLKSLRHVLWGKRNIFNPLSSVGHKSFFSGTCKRKDRIRKLKGKMLQQTYREYLELGWYLIFFLWGSYLARWFIDKLTPYIKLSAVILSCPSHSPKPEMFLKAGLGYPLYVGLII